LEHVEFDMQPAGSPYPDVPFGSNLRMAGFVCGVVIVFYTCCSETSVYLYVTDISKYRQLMVSFKVMMSEVNQSKQNYVVSHRTNVQNSP